MTAPAPAPATVVSLAAVRAARGLPSTPVATIPPRFRVGDRVVIFGNPVRYGTVTGITPPPWGTPAGAYAYTIQTSTGRAVCSASQLAPAERRT